MMTRPSKLLLLLIALAGLAVACNPGTAGQVVSVERLIGHRIETSDGVLVGELLQVLLNPRDGELQYGVIQLVPGPFHYSKAVTANNPPKIVVPWRTLTVSDDGAFLVIDASINQLWQAPQFSGSGSVQQPGWDEALLRYWATPTADPK
jgi:sporulation protein YlmC with PRC-barrel domain